MKSLLSYPNFEHTKFRKETMKKILVLLAVAALFAACGNSSSEAEKQSSQPETQVQEKQSSEESESATASLELSGNDQMQFDKKELQVKAGQEVTLTLKHSGKMEKNVMGHNFILLKAGVNVDTFALNAVKLTETEYLPEDKSDIIAHTEMIGGGESTSVTFTAPEPGTYDYICSFPGHYALMRGKFIVK
jgi:azurin